MAKRRNDSAWRKQVLEKCGAYCRACGATDDLQADHVMPRGQGGESVVANGLPLCGPWSKTSPHPGGCHDAKTQRRMLLRPEWLDGDTLEYLKSKNWVDWDEDGQPFGIGWRGFAPQKEAASG